MLADSDGDGYSNLLEYALGTDPNLSTPIFPLTYSLSSGEFVATFEVNMLMPDALASRKASETALRETPYFSASRAPEVKCSCDKSPSSENANGRITWCYSHLKNAEAHTFGNATL